MERLTFLDNGSPAYRFKGCVYKNEIARKLYAYEDRGLTPEEVKTLQEDNARLQKLIDRDTAKKVDEEDCCPICNTYGKDDEGVQGEFCPNCGQRLD